MRKKITNGWFFSTPNHLLKFLTIFIKGDQVLLFPLVVLITISYAFSLRMGVLLTGANMYVRFLGEMFYWIMQQFGDRKYRPNDFGFTNLDNHAIYILYQTFAIFVSLCGIMLLIYGLLYLR